MAPGSSAAVLGVRAATIAADTSVAKAKKIAAHAMEEAKDDIEFADGVFRVVGTDRAVSLQEVAQAAYVPSQLPEGAVKQCNDAKRVTTPRDRMSSASATSAATLY